MQMISYNFINKITEILLIDVNVFILKRQNIQYKYRSLIILYICPHLQQSCKYERTITNKIKKQNLLK